MSLTFLLPFLLGIAFFVAVARATFYRPQRRKIDDVILFVRKLEVSELELLMDVGEEWTLRHLLTEEAFRISQLDRIRLAGEYLHRVAHNAEVIQLWMSGEHESIKYKNHPELTEKDRLVLELLQLATELRIYSSGALMKVWLWKALRAGRWPVTLVPEVTDLRVTCGINVVVQYRKLRETASSLSLAYGRNYHDKLIAAL